MAFQSLVQIFRDFFVDGVPSSGKNKPKKSDIRDWGAWVESILNAFLGNGGLVYTSRASLFGDLAHGANSSAWVIGDATVAFNGVYMKSGSSGSGSWSRVSDLPFSFVIASDVGAGTPDAIQATSSIPISGSSLVVTNVFETNVGSPVTISFNGGTPVTIKTNDGSDVVPGGLPPVLFGYVQGGAYRCINDVVSASIVAAAQAQANAATASAALAASYAAGVNLPAVTPNTMLVDNAAGTARESKTFAQVKALLDILPIFRPEDYGAIANGVADCGPALRSCADAINNAGGGVMALSKGTYLVKTLGANGRFFTPYANMAVQGFGTGKSVIKLDDGVAGASFIAIYNGNSRSDSTACHNFQMRDLTIDYNGQNNQTTNYTGGIYIAVGDDVTIDNVETKNFPGSQPLVIGATFAADGVTLLTNPRANRPRITNNRFRNVGNTVNLNINDSSDIYVVCLDGVVNGNILVNDTQDTKGTAIELHGTGVCIGNVMFQKGKMFNVGAYPNSSWVVNANKGRECCDFATLWNNVGTGSFFSLIAKMEGNILTTGQLPTVANHALINASTNVDNNGLAIEITIKDNTFEFIGTPGTNTSPVLTIGPGQFYEFSGNTVAFYPAEVIVIDQSTGVKPSGRTSLTAIGNKILNCCAANQAGHTIAMLLNGSNALGAFVATGNIFRNDGGFMTKCFQGTAIPAAAPQQIVANNATINVAAIGP